jgi:SAM-dependent methyltransferase
MNFIARYALNFSQKARGKRAEVFRQLFTVGPDTKLLDLGSEVGEHIAKLVADTAIIPANVYIADIDADAVAEGARRFGFTPVVINESGRLPFPDGYFDVVHCSSVVEHVTIPKADIWSLRSGREFRRRSEEAQAKFAQEIKRVGRQYYVQTPDKWFPVESHSWLPFVGWLPRRVLIPVLRLTNSFWVKKTSPDWHLLDARELSGLFEGGSVVREKSFGMVKSITACKVECTV